jgi:hypothetical protein
MARLGREAPSLLAARRLDANPSAGFRAISGLILAVFVASLVSSLAASAHAQHGFRDPLIPLDSVALVLPPPTPADGPGAADIHAVPRGALDPADAHALVADLHTIRGVRGVVDVRSVPDGVDVARIDGQPPVYQRPVLTTCATAAQLQVTGCTGTVGIDIGVAIDKQFLGIVPLTANVSAAQYVQQPIVGVAVFTDGSTAAIERARTRLDIAFPGAAAMSGADLVAEGTREVRDIERLSNTALVVTLLIAGCSLAVSVAGGLVERKRPFALLRLAGMPLRDLHRVVIAEAAAPLLGVAATSVVLGFVVDALLLSLSATNETFHFPTAGYWVALAGGLGFALAIVAATLPLLDRLTSLETARFE